MNDKVPVPDIDLTRTPESYWIGSTPQTNYPALEEDVTVDVAIIGGGLVGISTAWLLKKDGSPLDRLRRFFSFWRPGHNTRKIN